MPVRHLVPIRFQGWGFKIVHPAKPHGCLSTQNCKLDISRTCTRPTPPQIAFAALPPCGGMAAYRAGTRLARRIQCKIGRGWGRFPPLRHLRSPTRVPAATTTALGEAEDPNEPPDPRMSAKLVKKEHNDSKVLPGHRSGTATRPFRRVLIVMHVGTHESKRVSTVLYAGSRRHGNACLMREPFLNSPRSLLRQPVNNRHSSPEARTEQGSTRSTTWGDATPLPVAVGTEAPPARASSSVEVL